MRVARFYAAVTIALAIVIGGGILSWLLIRNRTETLTLTSGQSEGVYVELANAIKKVVDNADGKLKIEVLQSDGTGQNLDRIAKEEADLAIVQNDVHGDRSVRTLIPLHNGVLHFWVLEDSQIASISDLKGRKVAAGLPESGTPQLVRALCEHYEIDEGEIDFEELSLAGACEALRGREVDAILMTMGLHSKAFEKLASETRARLVGIGEATGEGCEIEGFKLRYPLVEPRPIPRFAYSPPLGGRPGVPPEPVAAISVRAILVANERMPRRIARRITRILVENRAALAKLQPSAAELSEHFDSSRLQFPVHPGATAFYRRDEPGFLKENAEVIGFLVSIGVGAIGLVLSARQWWVHRQKDRIDAYYLDLDRILSRLREAGLTRDELSEMEGEVQSIRRGAVRQLASDKLLPNESFRIFQSLLNDCEATILRRSKDVA